MRSLYILAFIAFSTGFALPAIAEGTAPTSPMRYTRIQDAPDTDNGYIKLRTIKPEEEEVKKEEEEPSVRIWNRYKALAAGKPEETEDGKKEETVKSEEPQSEEESEPTVTEKVKKEEIEKEERPQSGIAALID